MTQLQNLSNSVCSILLMPYLAFKVRLVRMEVLPDCKLEDLQQESMQLAAQGCIPASLSRYSPQAMLWAKASSAWILPSVADDCRYWH